MNERVQARRESRPEIHYVNMVKILNREKLQEESLQAPTSTAKKSSTSQSHEQQHRRRATTIRGNPNGQKIQEHKIKGIQNGIDRQASSTELRKLPTRTVTRKKIST
jgi:type VI protein secretion system component VasA